MRYFACAWMVMALSMAMCTTSHAVERLTVQWSVDVDQRRPNAPVALSVPVLVERADGASWIVLTGRDGWVHIYDIEGAEIKRFSLGEASDSAALLLDNGLVIVGDVAGYLYAVNPELGQVVWQIQLTASFSSAPIAVEHGFVVQTTDGRLYRFSSDGEKVWSFSSQNSALSMYLNASPLVVNGRIYALFGNGDAAALKADSGDLLWKRQLLLSNGGSSLSDLKAPLATPLFLPTLRMDGEDVKNAVLMAFFHGDTVAVSAADGTQYLSLPLSLKSSPVVVKGLLYAADSKGVLHAYDIEGGDHLWSKKMSESALMGPVVWQDSLWLTSQQGKVYQVNLAGDIQGEVELIGHIFRLPVATKAGLLVRTDRGVMSMVSQ